MTEEYDIQAEAEVQNVENEKRRDELSCAYKRLFVTDDGKVVLKDLGIFCHENSSCVNEQNPNQLQTFYESGKRRVLLRINGMLIKERKNGRNNN